MTAFDHDLVVVGGGPAGLSAAAGAAESGLDVLLVDEQPAPGGQIFRNVEAAPAAVAELLGPDFAAGRALVDRFRRSGAKSLQGCGTWSLAQGFEIGLVRDGAARLVRSRLVVIATGAMERPMPFPGWTRPGVATAGAAQALLKGDAAVPEGPIVLAGVGALLDLVAYQLTRAGADVRALIDLMPEGNRRRAARWIVPAMPYLAKGLGWRRGLARAGVRRHRGTRLVGVEEGRGARLAVTWASGEGARTIEADWLLVHQGVVPSVQLPLALRCRLEWNEAGAWWQPVRRTGLETTVEGAFVAGDGGGIVGAAGAALEGEIAGLEAARRLGAAVAEDRIETLLAARARLLRGRRFVDALFAPSALQRVPDEDEVVLCRCEEATVGDIRRLARLGVMTANQTKFFSRAGMGTCQGRQCGTTVPELLARACGTSVAAVGHFRARPPLKPITLGELAQVARAADEADVFRT